MNGRNTTHRDLIVFQKSFVAGKRICELTKSFPREEMYLLTDQVRRASRSVNANVASDGRKRRYEKHFRSTMNVVEAEAAETQVWIECAAAYGYLDTQTLNQAIENCDEILRTIVAMIHGSSKWCVGISGSSDEISVKETNSQYETEVDTPTIDQQLLLSLTPTPK